MRALDRADLGRQIVTAQRIASRMQVRRDVARRSRSAPGPPAGGSWLDDLRRNVGVSVRGISEVAISGAAEPSDVANRRWGPAAPVRHQHRLLYAPRCFDVLATRVGHFTSMMKICRDQALPRRRAQPFEERPPLPCYGHGRRLSFPGGGLIRERSAILRAASTPSEPQRVDLEKAIMTRTSAPFIRG